MPKFKMKRKQIFHLENSDPTLLLYDPYVDIFVLPPRKTITGNYGEKICLSVGRTFNENKAKKFFSKCDNCGSDIDIKTQDVCSVCNTNFKKKKYIAERWAKELRLVTPDELIDAAKMGKLKGMLLKAGVLMAQKMDIRLPEIAIKKEAKYQSYEMFKCDNVGEISQLVFGSLIALGKSIRLFGKEEDLKNWKRAVREKTGKLMDIGYTQ